MRKACGAIISLLMVVVGWVGWAWAEGTHGGGESTGGESGSELPAEDEPPILNETLASLHDSTGGLGETGAAEQLPCGSCGACPYCRPASGTLEFFGPIAVINQHPLTTLFLSPVPEQATVLPRGASYFKLKLDWTNHIIRERDSGVIADYDFETLRTTLVYHRGGLGGELSARLPYTHRGHGVLDNIITQWHSFFGLPNGKRSDFPDFQYRYIIVTRQGPVFNDEGDSNGLGDIALGFKYPLWNRGAGRHALAVRAGAKLPTGDPDTAMGSGNWDFSLGALYQRQITPHLRAYVNADWVFVGEPDWDNIGYQDMLVTAWAAEYAVSRSTTLVALYRTHRNALRTGSLEADKDSQELGLGFNTRLSGNLVWSGGFNEDINPETAPDFMIMTNLKWDL